MYDIITQNGNTIQRPAQTMGLLFRRVATFPRWYKSSKERTNNTKTIIITIDDGMVSTCGETIIKKLQRTIIQKENLKRLIIFLEIAIGVKLL